MGHCLLFNLLLYDNKMARHKAKSQQLKRNVPKREPYDRVLIVCEGEKTEPYYFNYLKNKYKLSTANIEITGESSSSPNRVVEYAKDLVKEAIKNKNPFDKVFCVFDKDKHEKYNDAIIELETLSKRNLSLKNPTSWKDALINSVPCFEYWYLLHFEYTTQPFTTFEGKGGSSEEVIERLKKHIPNYEKSNEGIFILLATEDIAIKNSKKALEEAEKNQTDNPSTKVHILVEYLKSIKK